jgi:sigma-B regulation protein RsbU (phosphoserine phosphatase)
MTAASRKLLIIDDDPNVRESLASYLLDVGFDVVTTDNAPEAISTLSDSSQNFPDLIITDLRMPDVDGLDFLKKLQVLFPILPVIVISGEGQMLDVVTALRLGAKDYLAKPILDLDVLVQSIQRVLEKRDLKAQNHQYRLELERANTELKANLRILERDQIAGRRVQRRLMPSGVTTPQGYHAAHTIIPSLFLSGDFVDYAHINQRYLAFYLADVSGHGASSAFITIWLKHLVSRMVREQGLFGSEQSFDEGTNMMLSHINKELLETKLSHHMTLFLGVIDTMRGVMRYVVAGHLPLPILITKDGAGYLSGRGKPAGIFKSVEWEQYEIQLPDEFALVCFSDGVLESMTPDSLEQKEAALLDVIKTCNGTIDDVVDVLNLKQLKDNPDDIAVLSISRGVRDEARTDISC